MFELDGLLFDWDKNKNLSNIRKHGVSFKVAATAFFDPQAQRLDDFEHSWDEDRFVLIGYSDDYQLLTVCHCRRDIGERNVIRIFSAREASELEQKIYGGDEYGFFGN